ncbi:MAG: NAD(P)-dependent oxidoreductase [Eubacteriales bacterium]
MDALVGYTGFVGSNLADAHAFDALYNTKNIGESVGTMPQLLVYSGVPAQKFVANQNPETDLKTISGAIENIKKIKPENLVLISTIDVYKNPLGVDEGTVMVTDGLHPYGHNRLVLENWVRENTHRFKRTLIVRLPGLFGKNLKKNFVYDLIHIIPSMLNKEKYEALSADSDLIKENYLLQPNGFFACRADEQTKQKLKSEFTRLGFTALNFTDSRARFQMYNLAHLWTDIQTALKEKLKVVNLATEPVTAAEIYALVHDKPFINEQSRAVPNYDFQTRFAKVFGGHDGYITDKATVLIEIKTYIEAELKTGE